MNTGFPGRACAELCKDCPKWLPVGACRIGALPGTVECALAQEDWADLQAALAAGGREPCEETCGTCISYVIDDDGVSGCLRGTVYWGEGCADIGHG